MFKMYIYTESLLFFLVFTFLILPIYRVSRTLIKAMDAIHTSADFYSAYEIRFWEAKKARAKYNELFVTKIGMPKE